MSVVWKCRGMIAPVAAAALLAGCASPGPFVLIDVPFMEQPPNRCGAASLEMVAQYLGAEVDRAVLDHEIYIPALAGTVPELMAEGIRKQGLSASVEKGTKTDLQRLLQDGIPPILMLSSTDDNSKGHFVVVTGLNLQTGALRVHSGRDRNRWLSHTSWYPRWVRADCCMVVVRRP